MNEFDQFIKHELRIKHYTRYTDDFIIIANKRDYLERLIPHITNFLDRQLCLALHPGKVGIRPISQGVDFLGYVMLPKYRLLRTKTKKRIFRKIQMRIQSYRAGDISKLTLEKSLQSYLGVLSHAETYTITNNLKNQYWFWLTEFPTHTP